MNADADVQMIGNMGCYLDDSNTFTFQTGANPMNTLSDPGFENEIPSLSLPQSWLSVKGYNVAARGSNNHLIEEQEKEIKENRLLPRLFAKQQNMLYGQGPALYIKQFENNKISKQWTEVKAVTDWLEGWTNNGMEMSYTDFCLANIRNHYYYRDFFVKHRISQGAVIGRMPIAGLESVENKDCRLATSRQDVVNAITQYRDLRFIVYGNWSYGGAQFLIYPRFEIREISNYNYAAISHHREKSTSEFYGCNETHQGTRGFIQGSNMSAGYINSFLKNSIAAKVHVIIPNAWMESKRKQITKICEENKKLAAASKTLHTYNGVEVGVDFKESSLIKFLQEELRRFSNYLSGVNNQGKAWATVSFTTGSTSPTEERWRIETVDLKYKEYIESMISYDKRSDEVISASVGMDSSISSISKDGIISKSGSDVYYNYILYLLSLTPDDEKCSEPLNLALKINFPQLYSAGYRFGFYREIPSRQEDVAPNDRLNKQES
jgi:hypothetical protein